MNSTISRYMVSNCYLLTPGCHLIMKILSQNTLPACSIIALLVLVQGCDGETAAVADTVSPEVSISSHDSTTVSGSPQTIVLEGQARDDTEVETITFRVNTGEEQPFMLSNGSYSETIVLVEDNNKITVTVTDTGANTASASVDINYIAEGNLQQTFGEDLNPVDSVLDGFVVRDSGSHNGGFGLVMAQDGSFFTVGYAKTNGGTGDYDMGLWKINSDGVFDADFGTDGFVYLDDPKSGTGNTGTTDDRARAVTMDNAGNVIVVGRSDNDIAIARFNATSGDLDTTFGGDINPIDGSPDGFVVLDVSGSGSSDDAAAVTVDDDDNIYVVGTSDNVIYIWKFTSVGVLDTTFGAGNGFVSYDSASTNTAADLAIDSAGRLVVLGQTVDGVTLWRMDSNGNADTDFGSSGKATAPSPYTLSTMLIDNNDNIIVGGSITNNVVGDSEMTLWKFTNTGILDISFGDGTGRAMFLGIDTAEKDDAFDLAFDAAGNIVVAGTIHTDVVNKNNTAIWRYSANGVLDTTFATDGFFIHTGAASPGGTSNLDRGFGLVIDSTGNIVVSGDSFGSAGADVVFWKLK